MCKLEMNSAKYKNILLRILVLVQIEIRLTDFNLRIKVQYCVITIIQGKTSDIILAKRDTLYFVVIKTDN
jgi:hypothetical protein